MYAWLWRRLPGPVAVRVLQLLVLAVAVVAALFGVVFPWVDLALGLDGVSVG
ncbi:hypothetical protein [Actinomycetospora straminea]|uniref:hypothetical protein n=1 Tax=Actinomycetospora straminea TaxID=663607 RepID=UPI0023666845|nr:hypothetical protein [Actinomycetospora straminea]MDD7933898.1 hypothetical protein [Actinomycetospora straminea]